MAVPNFIKKHFPIRIYTGGMGGGGQGGGTPPWDMIRQKYFGPDRVKYI